MRDVVREVFYSFNAPMEGEVPFFYQDVKGLVSIGVGILCDPIQLALGLPLVHADGRPATRNEIAAEWLRIKNLPPNSRGQTAAQLGHLYAKPHTTLSLTRDGLEYTMMSKVNQMDAYLETRFPGYSEWPADAQLGALSLSWACGPAFRFPKCEAALRSLDFRTAAVECFMPEERTISGLRPRNRVNRLLFNNAAVVVQEGHDPGVLYYPNDLSDLLYDGARADRDDEITQPMPVPVVRPDPIGAQTVVDWDRVHPRVPLGIPSLDIYDDEDEEPDDEPPKAA
jgi:hypothetical protein